MKNLRWVRNPIDHFVLARLEKERLKPSREADRVTLIRRLSLDLTGLPPTPEEVEAFLNDRRADAYERLVDRLLDSPHYGEQWGRHWLDLARYADSDGYEKDSPRPYAWLYRDWVIRALNRDLPFDRFTLEQLAGDLLPDATDEQRIATGFHRNTLTNREGGIDPEEDRVKQTVDRVNTTGTVWLGLTVGCAECHSHKYDPISQREYYGLFAFFNSVKEVDLPAPQPAELANYKQAKAAFDVELARLKAARDADEAGHLAGRQLEWEKTVRLPETRWTTLKPLAAKSASGAALKLLPDDSVLATEKSPATDTCTIEVQPRLDAITSFRLEVLDDPSLPIGPGRARNGNFVLSEFVVKVIETGSSEEPRLVVLRGAVADWSSPEWPVGGAIDGDTKTGWAIDPQFNRRHAAVFELKEPLRLAERARLSFTLDQQYGKEHTLGRFRLSATAASPPLMPDVLPATVVEILQLAPDQRAEEQRRELREFYRSIDDEFVKLDLAVAQHAQTEPAFPETKAQTLAENPKPPKTHVHVRGDFLRKGEEVQPETPAVLPPLRGREISNSGEQPTVLVASAGSADTPSAGGTGRMPVRLSRLDLARWLVDPANPLTARVHVNRVWQHLFGFGLVRTPDDFGTRGERPTHPELLDWLATEFPRLGWSQKALIRLIVNSATYRQSSYFRADLAERDPSNLLLARQNRFRLEAENIRDLYLGASGLLNRSVGGPSVKPPLPADIAALGYANSVKWRESEGADRYRRGLYIFLQRTVPYPMLSTFDAADMNVTCTRRERSNTPLQALTLLNDPVLFECAQALGRRMAGRTEADLRGKLQYGVRRCLAREPTKTELARLAELYARQQAAIAKTSASAAQIAGTEGTSPGAAVEAASLVAVARTLLNLEEFVTRE